MRRLNPISSTALAATLAALVLLTLLGHKPLTDWDEAIYAEVAREMLTSGNWLVPHWNLQPWFEKPPLLMWVTASFYKLFGVSEFTARAASALSGIAIVALLHGWLARNGGLIASWISSIVLLSTFGFLHAARVGETDVLLSLGCVIALIGLAELDGPVQNIPPYAGQSPGRGWYLFWIGFAIAVMTKGAAAITLPLTAIAVLCLPSSALRKPANHQPAAGNRFGLPFWLGAALFLLLVLPWHLAMLHLFGRRFLAEYFGLHVLTRATQQIEGHNTHWWYYLKVLLVSAPPFVLLFPIALAHSLRRSSSVRAFALFALVGLGFFTLVETRLPHYIAPAYPALAVLTAAYVADKLQSLLTPQRPASLYLKLTAATAVIWIAGILLTASARKSLHSAVQADGKLLPDNKEATALLREAFRQPQPIPGPLLVWRENLKPEYQLSIATDVFYCRRHVQQVELAHVLPNIHTDRYTFRPEPLADAVTGEPRLILIDRALIPLIPVAFVYTPIQTGKSVELGTIMQAR